MIFFYLTFTCFQTSRQKLASFKNTKYVKNWSDKNVDDKQHSPKIIFSYEKNEEESDDI